MDPVVIKEEIISDDDEMKDNSSEDPTDRGFKHDGYYYIRDKVTKTTPRKVYLRCKQIGKGLCKSRATLTGDIFTITKPHNHGPNDTAYAEIMFKKALRERCLNGVGSARSIYNELLPDHLQAAERMPFSRMENSLHRWLKKFTPPMPNDLNHYGDLIRNPPWSDIILHSDTSFINKKIVDEENGIVIVVFYNSTVIEKIQDADILYVDSSYKTKPEINDTSQMVTFLTVKSNIRSQMGIPFIWALMNKLTELAYKKLLEFVRNELVPAFKPVSCMLDYEKSLNSAMMDVYPNVLLQRCYYNYCQSILRMAEKLNIISKNEKNNEKMFILYKLMALALLPAIYVEEGFQHVMEQLPKQYMELFQPLLNYYDIIWLKTVSALLFSVFDTIDRLNNLFESYHRMLQYTFQPKQSALDFTRSILKLQTTVKNEVLKARKTESSTKKSSVGCLISERDIKNAWAKITVGELSVNDFVDNASEYISKAIGTLLVIEMMDDDCRQQPDLIEGCVSKYDLQIEK